MHAQLLNCRDHLVYPPDIDQVITRIEPNLANETFRRYNRDRTQIAHMITFPQQISTHTCNAKYHKHIVRVIITTTRRQRIFTIGMTLRNKSRINYKILR